jgi:hypothetical protein
MAEFHTLTTEQKNLSSLNIDKMSGAEIARCINEEDKTVAFAVEKCLPEIGEAIELLAEALQRGGRIFYCGAGTSGFEDQENMIYFIESTMFDAILDVSQVESLMFHKGWDLDAEGKPTIQTFYYIPVANN